MAVYVFGGSTHGDPEHGRWFAQPARTLTGNGGQGGRARGPQFASLKQFYPRPGNIPRPANAQLAPAGLPANKYFEVCALARDTAFRWTTPDFTALSIADT